MDRNSNLSIIHAGGSVPYVAGEGADPFAYDMLYQGPALGIAFRF